MVESLAEVGADLADLAVAEGGVAIESRQARAVDELGGHQRVAVFLAELVKGDDAGMVEPRGGLGLAQDAVGVGRGGLDRLDRDGALQSPIPGLVDGAEAASADAALDQEAVEDERADHCTPRLRRESASSCDILPASWRISPHPGQAGGPGRAAVPNASRSCCGGAWRSAARFCS